eukprot:COSAG06_NODE_496_length_15043_cov_8.883565_15_plen_86_part_00
MSRRARPSQYFAPRRHGLASQIGLEAQGGVAADGERAPLVGPRAQSTMALSTGIIKLLLGLGNLAFFVRTTRPRLSSPRRRSMDA